MSETGPDGQGELSPNDVVRRALEAEPDPINIALLAIEGDRTIIVTDGSGVAREVSFVAPGFPETYQD